MDTYLVTGGCGFIGYALVKSLSALGYKVVVIDNLSNSKNTLASDIDFIEGDCGEISTIDKLDKYDIKTIFHIAGQSSGELSWIDPVYDMKSNATSTLLLLEYAKQKQIKNFIYTSSMAVYGNPTTFPVRENDSLKPQSLYGIGKIASEHYLRLYAEEYEMNCIALRLNNIYGPGQNMENLHQGMVSIYLAYALEQHHIPVLGSGKRFRDFVYIDDVIEAILSTNRYCQHLNGKYDVFNVSTGIKTTCEELIMLIQDYLPFDVTVEYNGRTKGDTYGIYCSYDKITNMVGWIPKTKLDIGLKKMIDFYINSEVHENETN
ncbi:MAG: NAD-dependent epimerase/dehydratase family protein [Clostridia bacterium]|nr:NAD-dependent epimerase/dehydratase family protein [Clostridia bacterium]